MLEPHSLHYSLIVLCVFVRCVVVFCVCFTVNMRYTRMYVFVTYNLNSRVTVYRYYIQIANVKDKCGLRTLDKVHDEGCILLSWSFHKCNY